ncbi:hypothetical protein F4779DRAFT_620434 [Xylariaceae sp. FL0662B]|nr:hypothetical protein F4779DRAFT_620434 [Xylariaceae sp. FL0662B]
MSSTVRRDEISDVDLSIRFKHGSHTIFLFVDPSKPFSDVAEELLEVLAERYPDGLTTSASPLNKSKLPEDAAQIEFAIPKMLADPSQGWKPLGVTEEDTPVSKGLKDNAVVAFAFRPEDADENDEIPFPVDFPSYDDDYAGGQ